MKSPNRYSVRWLLLVTLFFLSGCRTGRGPEEPPPEKRPPPFPEYSGGALRLPQRRRPLEDFERTASLEVSSPTGRAFLLKNTEQAIWGSSAAEIRFVPEKDEPHVVTLRPETPWQMPSLFDNVSIWIRDDGLNAVNASHTLSLWLKDGEDRFHELRFPYTPSEGWQMLQQRLSTSFVLPVEIHEVRWKLPRETSSARRILLEGLTLYQEVLSRIPTRAAYVRPFNYAPAFAPVRENSVRLNFPTTEYAFHPASTEERHVTKLSELGNNTYRLDSISPTTKVSYRVSAEEGGPRVEVSVNDSGWVEAWTGPRAQGLSQNPTNRFSRIRGNELYYQYTDGISFTLSLRNKTLMISVESLREDLQGLDLGTLYGQREVHTPFLRIGEGDSFPVRVQEISSTPVFLCVFPDWWFSMASSYQSDPDPQSLGRLLYLPRWRGSRNIFRERIYFTAAPSIADVLPTVSTPGAMYQENASRLTFSPAQEDAFLTHSLFRILPSEREWEDQLLARRTDGEWRLYPNGRGVVLKTALAEQILIPRLLRIQENRPSSFLLLPEATAHGPWRFTDYDNRVVGAGTFAQTYAEMGALLQQTEAEWGRPLLGKGGAEILWAGLVSGFVPEFPSLTVWRDPWVPHLAWNSITRVSSVLGMGAIESFRASGEPTEMRNIWLDRSLATQVAYGAPGRIPASGISPQKTLLAERLIAAVQEAFTGRTADRIAYWNGERFVDLGSALTDQSIRENRIYLRLNDQTEIWVNGSQNASWDRRVGGDTWTLPPFGFLIRGPDHFIVHQPDPAGSPGICFIETPTSVWFTSPGRIREKKGMTLQGSIQLHTLDEDLLRMDVEEWHGEARFSADRIPLNTPASIRALNSAGAPVADLRFTREGDNWTLKSSETLKTVWISERVGGGERNLLP